ncbi:MAG: nicotinamide mononucleotide transporter [Clostridia bacterium]|nr:nicotinamide mononucleotide transporter [Clostridia bacterium]
MSAKLKTVLTYFTRGEWILLTLSLLTTVVSYCLQSERDPLSLVASLIGVVALIFCAKGHPIGQVLIILFSILYGIISYSFAYYGEMLTYLGMSLPMAILSLVSWLRNPYEKGKGEVRITRHLTRGELCLMLLLTLLVTAIFYYILKALATANLLPSTLSVATSFLAVYLTFRRSPFYALAYAANDIVLIVLWILASLEDISYLSVAICFLAFLANDIYGFINWRRMSQKQAASQ